MEIQRTYYTVDNKPVTESVIVDDNGKPFKTKSLAKQYCVKNEMRNMTLCIHNTGYCLKERTKINA